MKRSRLLIVSGLASAVLILVPGFALAFGAKTGDNVTLGKNDTNHGTLYAAGQNITIDGTVDGDLICAGNTVTVNGTVRGDVICAGQTVTVNGNVNGNIRAAGQTVMVNGAVTRNVSAAAQAFTLGTKSSLKGEADLFGDSANINGAVAKDLNVMLSTLSLTAPVSGSLNGNLEQANISGEGRVAGDFNYTAEKRFSVSDSKVGGKVNFKEVKQKPQPSPRELFITWLSNLVYWIIATWAIIVPLVWLAPRAARSVLGTMEHKTASSIGWGALFMLAGLLVFVALLFTVAGLPLAFLLFGLWLLAVFAGGWFAQLAIGNWLLKHTQWDHKSLVLAALLGVPASLILFNVPIVGGLLHLVAIWWGLGALVQNLRYARENHPTDHPTGHPAEQA